MASLDPKLRAEIETLIANKVKRGDPIIPDTLAQEIVSKWSQPTGRDSVNWIFAARETLRRQIEDLLIAKASTAAG